MTDRTCSTCKHWTRHPWPNRLGWHDTGTCATLHVTPAHTISERDMFPMLDTHRDFGCVKWDGEVSASDKALQSPYNWGSDGKPEAKTFVYPEFGKPDLTVSFVDFGKAVELLRGEQDD